MSCPTELRFGLIGKSLSHSFSPAFFAQKFQALGLPHSYRAFALSEIAEFVALTQMHPLSGLNVTIPYKEAIIPFLDGLSPQAQAIGAVNTIHFAKDGCMTGHNTDWVGFAESLAEAWCPTGPYTALVLGTGGASKAVVYALQQDALCMGILQAARTPQPQAPVKQLSYEQISPQLLASCSLVINTTPVGMHPHEEEAPTLPWKGAHPAQHYYDLIYNPAHTRFLQLAQQAGATTQNGLRMLHLQAEAAWDIWQQ